MSFTNKKNYINRQLHYLEWLTGRQRSRHDPGFQERARENKWNALLIATYWTLEDDVHNCILSKTDIQIKEDPNWETTLIQNSPPGIKITSRYDMKNSQKMTNNKNQYWEVGLSRHIVNGCPMWEWGHVNKREYRSSCYSLHAYGN